MWNLDIPHPTSSVVTVELPETGYICNIVVTQPQITLFFLYFCENIDVSIGEFFATVGFPSGIYDAPYQLYYDSNDRLLPSGWSLFDRVVIANFYSENVTHNEWHGFVPLWRYCQLEPELELPDCTK
jgi:hypothetical protein